MSQIEEAAAAVGGNIDRVREVAGALAASREKVAELASATAALGLEARASEAHGIGEDLGQVAEQQNAMVEQLEQIRIRLEALKGLPREGSVSAPQDRSVSAATVGGGHSEAGAWATPPKRHHGNDFNQRYERWVKTSNDGPDDEREYRVRGVWFDARRFETEDGRTSQVLLDAKGEYDQFIDRRSGDWQEFFQKFPKSGIQGLISEAKRQVSAAGDQPVEWWCAQKDSARLIRRWFRDVPELEGRMRVVYKPMPDTER